METFRTAKIPRAGVSCVKCGKDFRKGASVIVRTYKSPMMAAPGFYYYHKKCAPKRAK